MVNGYTYARDEAIPPHKLEECACVAACLGAERLVKLCDNILRRPETYMYKGAPDILFYRKDIFFGKDKQPIIAPVKYSFISDEARRYRSIMRCVNHDITNYADRFYIVNPNGELRTAQKCLKRPWLYDNIFAVEVKGGNDTLSDVQMCWLQLLRDEIGVHVEVLLVDEMKSTPVY